MQSQASAADLEVRRRAIRVRACRRGLREMDIILGGFVEARVDGLDARDIGDLERLLDEDDQTVFTWFSGGAPVPPEWEAAPVFQAIKAFHTHLKPVHI